MLVENDVFIMPITLADDSQKVEFMEGYGSVLPISFEHYFIVLEYVWWRHAMETIFFITGPFCARKPPIPGGIFSTIGWWCSGFLFHLILICTNYKLLNK